MDFLNLRFASCVVDVMNALAASQSTPTPTHIEVKLSPTHELVPRELNKDYHPEYAVVGGLVLVIAGLPILDQVATTRIMSG